MDFAALLLAFLSSLVTVLVTMPPLIEKMRQGGMVGHDVNKRGRPTVAELGGIAAVFAFSISLSVVVGLKKLSGFGSGPGLLIEAPYLAALSVFFIASMVGLIDDISNIKQRVKAMAVVFASLPLLLVHLGDPIIRFPFGLCLDFSYYPQVSGTYLLYLIYWLILVPIGVTGMANAMNMSAGYNGLESGQVLVASLGLFIISILRGTSEVALIVFIALVGCSSGLFYFNRFPAKIFVGDIGTLGMGAAMAAGVIMGHIEFYAVVAIAPAFYEAIATIYFGLFKKVTNRREACHNPIINEDGTLSPPKGAERYTLAYYILSKKPMKEGRLVTVILALYALSCAIAIVLSVL